jgi:hypothetical protein
MVPPARPVLTGDRRTRTVGTPGSAMPNSRVPAQNDPRSLLNERSALMLDPNWTVAVSWTAMCPPLLVARSPWVPGRLAALLRSASQASWQAPGRSPVESAAAAVARCRPASAGVRRASAVSGWTWPGSPALRSS